MANTRMYSPGYAKDSNRRHVNSIDSAIYSNRRTDERIRVPRPHDIHAQHQTCGLSLPCSSEKKEWMKREKGTIPTWVFGKAFKVFLVAAILLLALTPIVLKLKKTAVELKRTRSHFKGYYELNPEMFNTKNIDPMGHYCHASFPGALKELKYRKPEGYEFVASQIITRGGDRSPLRVLPNEGIVTWDDCDLAYLDVEEGESVTRVRDEEISVKSMLWKGNCSPGDLTHKGANQLHMLGKVIGAVYSQFFEISPREVSVRSIDTQHTVESAKYFVKGLMENACFGGPVEILTGISEDIDILNPLTAKSCPEIAAQTLKLMNSPEWSEHTERHSTLMKSLIGITDLGIQDEAFKNWYSDFGYFHDSIHARFCNNKPLPCSREDPNSCITMEMASELFEASSFVIVHKSGGSLWPSLPRLQVGPLLQHLVHTMNKHVNFHETTKEKQYMSRINLYSARASTIGALLSAFRVEDWVKRPPYASNLLLELWKQADSQRFAIRLLYNGRLMSIPFCSEQIGADDYLCPFEFFFDFIKEHLVPENVEKECNKV